MEQGKPCVPHTGFERVFLTGAGDNGDSNSRSYTCRVDFHGFVFSLVFHPTPDNPGIPVVLDNDIFLDSEKGKKNVSPMPESYTEIDPTKTVDNIKTLKVLHLDINYSLDINFHLDLTFNLDINFDLDLNFNLD